MSESAISEQAKRYAEVIAGQIADNFQSLADSIAECSELKEALIEYKLAKEQGTFSKYLFEKNVDEYFAKVEEAQNKTSRSCYDAYNGIEPLAVGLFGEWGSGKTHQLKLIQHNIMYPPPEIAFPKTTIPVFFNAWRFEKEEHIVLPLFETLLDALENHSRTLDESAKKMFKSTLYHVKNIILSLRDGIQISSVYKTAKGLVTRDIEDLAELSKIIDEEAVLKKGQKRTDEEQVGEQTIKELLKPDELRSIYLNIPKWIEKITLFENINFVFLIDDLDRCLPENTLKMLESIKLFLDVPSCAFVLAVDDDVVERGVVHHYRDYLSIYHHKDTENAQGVLQHELPITGHEYLEKMIQLPIRLPVIDTVNVREFLKEHSAKWIQKVDEEYWEKHSGTQSGPTKPPSEALLDFFKEAIPPKPRKIKRVAKLFETKLQLLEANGLSGKVDYMFVAKLTLLELFVPKLLRYIQNHGYGLVFNTLCFFRELSYREAIEVKRYLKEPFFNSLLDTHIIREYIDNAFDENGNDGYTAKEKKIYNGALQIIEEHYFSRVVFDLDVIFEKQYDNDKLKMIVELREKGTTVSLEKSSKLFDSEFYQRLYRAWDVDAWISALSDNNALIEAEQLDELIKRAEEKIDKTFNGLPFITNPQWIGELACYVDDKGYRKLLVASHNARFKTFDKTNKKQMDRFQLTFSEYDKYCEIQKDGKKPMDEGWGRGRHPVINVSSNDAIEYIHWLNNFLENEYTYALPTETAWELACNQGKGSPWHFGDNEKKLKKYAWYDKNSDGKTHPVGSLKPNSAELYDMHGNVWEWCDKEKDTKVLKGGSWVNSAQDTQTADTNRNNPDYSNINFGFRLLRTLH